MDKVYCGCKDPPKGSRIGTVDECMKRGKLARYGLIKVDKETIDEFHKNSMSLKKLDKEISKLSIAFYKLLGEKKKILKEIERSKDEKEKAKMLEQAKKISLEAEKVGLKREEIRKYQKEMNNQLISVGNKQIEERGEETKPTKKYNAPITEFLIDDKIGYYWKIRKVPKLHNSNDSNVYRLLMTYKDAVGGSSRPNAYLHELSLVENYLKKGLISKLDELNKYLIEANKYPPEDPKLLEVLNFLNYIANRK